MKQKLKVKHRFSPRMTLINTKKGWVNMGKKKVVWVVSDDEHGVVVSHHHGLAARREGANELDAEFDDVTCRRAPELDQYADRMNELTFRMLVEEFGWFAYCSYCDRIIYKNEIALWDDDRAYCEKCAPIIKPSEFQERNVYRNYRDKNNG